MDVLLLYEAELLLQNYQVLGCAPEYDVKRREVVDQQKDLFQVTGKLQNTLPAKKKSEHTAVEYPCTQVQTKCCKACTIYPTPKISHLIQVQRGHSL